VPSEHPDSNYGVAAKELLNHVPTKHVFRMHGELSEREKATLEYDQTLVREFELRIEKFPNLILYSLDWAKTVMWLLCFYVCLRLMRANAWWSLLMVSSKKLPESTDISRSKQLAMLPLCSGGRREAGNFKQARYRDKRNVMFYLCMLLKGKQRGLWICRCVILNR